MLKIIDHITKRKDGRYMGRFISGYDENGKAIYQCIYGKTYEEVEEKLRIANEITSRFLSGKSVSVKTVYEEWLNAVVNRIKESTFANYKLKFEKHILPEFGDVSCAELSTGKINAFINRKLATGLSASYVRDIIIVFKTMLKYAQEEYRFDLSFKNISMPKCEKRQENKLADSEQRLLVEYLKQHIDLTSFGILISLFMGIRIGELCGLRWNDVDFKNRTLRIGRTVQRIAIAEGSRKTKVIVSSPKSSTSCRAISIPDFLMEYFEKFKADKDCYILSGSEKATEPRVMQYRYKRIMAMARVSYRNYHQLRHTFATNCMQNGFDIKTLSNVLGHSSVNLTLSRYVHPDFAHEQRLMNEMCMLF
ncbi:MAG: site-specific integrase [Lachnospiraceae bacterium]|nr:site-specific integrase [Ruminococcus sp.]MCM1273729.1 site-specific integrase [Lachnospiraceae bacterium]